MVKIIVEIPDEIAFRRKASLLQLSLWASKILQERLEEEEEIEDFRRIVSKSKATERDVEELSDEINESLAKHYSKYK